MRQALAPSQADLVVSKLRFALRLLAIFFVALFMCAASARAQSPTMRLRMEWGGSSKALWQGTIAVERGTVNEVRSLGIEADEPGSMWISEGQVLVQQRSPRSFDGVDLDISAPLDTKLIVVLSAVDRGTPEQRLEFPLASLVDDPQTEKLDDQGSRLVVRRTPGDKLRVRLENDTLVLEPGEPLSFELTPHMLGGNVQGQLQIKTEILTARGDRSWYESAKTIDVPARDQPADGVLMQVVAPDREGVFDLVITATQPKPRRGLAQVNPLADNVQIISQRRVQFLVLAKEPLPVGAEATAPTTVVDEIKPEGAWWERVSKLRHIPGLNKGPLTNGPIDRRPHPNIGSVTSIGPSESGKEPNWVAYPINVKQPGQVHVLEVEYPADQPQSLAITLLEPDSSGSVMPASLDSGVHVPKHAADDGSKTGVHRITFWPRSDAPIVLLTNQSEESSAEFGRIRILGPKPFAVGQLRISGSSQSYLPKAKGISNIEGGRLLAAYMQQPLLPENFSATEAFDSWMGRSLDDWVTFHESGSRAIQYLQHVGYNALVISAMSGGSTLYPSRLVEPTPRYDNGIYFTSGQDPMRKDVLEMMFRMCDRDGLKLIPALDFSAPLPELEAELRRDSTNSGIRLIGRTGRSWVEEHGRRVQNRMGRAVYYNPLNRRVQRAMLNVVREVTERYRHHPSFAGIMLSTANDQFALLPGESWALDDDTFGRFARDTGLQLSAEGPERFAARAEAVSGKARQLWLTWRAQQMKTFLTNMRREVEEFSSQTNRLSPKLYIAAEGIYTNSEVEETIRPALRRRNAVEQMPLSMGIDVAAYQDDEQIVVLRPRGVEPVSTVSVDAARRQLNESDALEAAFAEAGSSGSLFLHEAHRQRLTSFDKVSPFGSENTFVSLASQLMPSGAENRRRLIHSLATRDDQIMIDGGNMLPLGQETALTKVVAAYRQLPAISFKTLPLSPQPIVIRSGVHNGSTYLYLVNDSAWPVTVRLNAQGPVNVDVTDLGGSTSGAQLVNGQLTVELTAYDLAAYRFAATGITFSEGSTTIAQEAQTELAKRIDSMVARATALGMSKAIDVLENPDFESPAPANQIPGWNFDGEVGSRVDLDASQAKSGNRSVRLSSSGRQSLLVSDPFPMPPTGRLAFSVWLKTEPNKPVPNLRLAIGGQQADGQGYYGFGRIDRLNRANNKGWQHTQFQVDNLPPGGGGVLQIRFDLMGEGTVWIDDIEVSSMYFSPQERTQLSRMITKSRLLLNDGRISECTTLLRGYWPQFLEEHVEVETPRVAKTPPKARAPQAEAPPAKPAEEPKESWWKRGLPSFLK